MSTLEISPMPGGREQLCAVAPSPQLRERIQKQLSALRTRGAELSALSDFLSFRFPVRIGMNDGVVRPSSYLAAAEAVSAIRSAPAPRVPLRGQLRVAVILVDFPDKAMAVTKQHIEDLFFSSGQIPTGSVKEYYQEVTKGLVDIVGDVVGPLTMPHPITYYANNKSGLADNPPNAQQLALDAAQAADPLIDFTPFDNDGDGFVDAYVIVHAGRGAEETGSSGDIWSHKWVLPQGAYQADQTSIYGYLTVPEDCKLGVCAHELGHLLFGFPDLYDTDYSSEGIGNWCLMAGGSWNGNGDTPAHPSAWCKVNQNWAPILTPTSSSQITVEDVKAKGPIVQVTPLGGDGSEYFLMENRQQAQFDTKLPAAGLLVWHIDENVSDNTNENHYKVALLQADGRRDLETSSNRGDDGDPYPGKSGAQSIGADTNPNSRVYSGADSQITISNISGSGPAITFNLELGAQTSTARTRRHRPAA